MRTTPRAHSFLERMDCEGMVALTNADTHDKNVCTSPKNLCRTAAIESRSQRPSDRRDDSERQGRHHIEYKLIRRF